MLTVLFIALLTCISIPAIHLLSPTLWAQKLQQTTHLDLAIPTWSLILLHSNCVLPFFFSSQFYLLKDCFCFLYCLLSFLKKLDFCEFVFYLYTYSLMQNFPLTTWLFIPISGKLCSFVTSFLGCFKSVVFPIIFPFLGILHEHSSCFST